ncbi:hypothetical protein UFOVP207_7 [uncultured Caudovirales phage]|uniref:Portal protein n=1 Tax=uncultured Caudovirales phage TaxID=2100421 RepID=A0A6J7WQH3_9CAUD|nr:hypothetical protein UFOVP207_7 [uncultured Caudovirales phage]
MNNNHVIELSAYTAPIVTEDKRNEWVNYGEENNYYQFLIDRYSNSATHSAVVNNISRLIYGKGLSALDAAKKPNDYAQMLTLFTSNDLRRVIQDLYLLGQGAFQVHYDKGHKKIVKVFHIPVQLLRPEKCNEDGDVIGYYYSDNWEDTKKFVPKRFDAFGEGSSEVEILMIQPYSVGTKYFSRVDYQGALEYCVLEEKISEYLINEVTNGFSPTTIINFNNGTPTDGQKDEIARKTINKLTGSTGKKIVVSFNEDEAKKTTIDSVPLNDAPEHYQYLSDECRSKILTGHCVTSPLIFGIATTTGFSANADELKNSVILFDNMVIQPKQEVVIEVLNKILTFNGISLKLFFKTLQPLEFIDLSNAQTKEQVSQETGVQMSAEKSELEMYLDEIGEDIGEDWLLVDEREVNYDLEDELDLQLQPKKTMLSKVLNFVSSGVARPNSNSGQDKVIDGIQWKVRYQYTGNANPNRDFCKVMMNTKKVYRREDLEKMNSQIVNPGFEHDNEPYNVFLFKGGPRCKHSFKRLTFASLEGQNVDVNSPKARQIGTRKAEIMGYKITNPYQVSVQPNNLPLKGFHPNNKNLPSDVK